MKIISSIIWLVIAIGFPMLISCQQINKEAEINPNIIFIQKDDLDWQDICFMGSKWLDTPNLDALAKENGNSFSF